MIHAVAWIATGGDHGLCVFPMPRLAAFAARLQRLALLLPLVACSPTQDRTHSIWPPKDWYLEVRISQLCASGVTPLRSFQAWVDGYALFREAEMAQGDTPAPWPALWSRAAAYQMGHESTRQLARLVATSGFESLPAELGSLDAGEGPVLAFSLRAFGKVQRVTAHSATDPKIARLLHVVNAFLPKGESVALPDMIGDREDPHLSRVPTPMTSRANALELHEGLLGRDPGGDGFLLDAFALAVALGDRPRSQAFLDRIEAAELVQSRPFELSGELPRLAPTLRALLPK